LFNSLCNVVCSSAELQDFYVCALAVGKLQSSTYQFKAQFLVSIKCHIIA
jgi:hypothetical protein